jgi:MFS family permease
MDTTAAYTTATWAMSGALLALIAYQARCKCFSVARACTALESVYLPVYTLAICADWLQGPYVYALYASLGYGRTDINILFVTGFATSGLLGPFIGQLADQFGRKQMILVMYCGAYALACVTKHFQLYWMLSIGRFLGGAATSVLFSCFESWLVAEHHRRGLAPVELEQLLSRQYFLNGLSGCTMGILAQFVVDSMPLQPVPESFAGALSGVLYYGGETLSFDLSFACLLIASLLVCFLWSENIWFGAKPPGDTEATASEQWRIPEALGRMGNDKLLLTIMVVSAATESAMYAFVIEWTPALTLPSGEGPPHGLVFSCFMIAYMAGSILFGLLAQLLSPAGMLIAFSSTSLLAVGGTFLAFHTGYAATQTGIFVVFLLLTTFELGLGGYMAAIATLKATYVPDDLRATVYNLFRVPLNLIVVVINVVSLSSEFTFLSCTCLMAIALAGAVSIRMQVKSSPAAAPMI